MGLYSFDLSVQGILAEGLAYIRAHSEVLDDIFSHLTESWFTNQYGQREITHIKKWFLENDLPVVLGYNLVPQVIPGFSIHLAQSVEDAPQAFFGDHGGEDTVLKDEPIVKVDWFVPTSIVEDATSGLIVLTIPRAIDLTLIRVGHLIRGNDNELYTIYDLSEVGTTSTISVTWAGADYDLSKVRIESYIVESTHKRGEAYFNEQLDIGIHAHADTNMVLWMYYIVVWILMRFKPEMERRGLEVTTFSASDFSRDSQYLGENVFSRWLRLAARTRMTWNEEAYPEVDTVVATVDVDGGSEVAKEVAANIDAKK